MALCHEFHKAYGATWMEDHSFVAHYGRPDREQLAVRNGVGILEHSVDILRITGSDRIGYVDNVISNQVPKTPNRGAYGLLLDPDGTIRFDLQVYTAADQVLLVVPPGEGESLAGEWNEKIFIQDVSIDNVSESHAFIGCYGPDSREKLLSVLPLSSLPESHWHFTQSTVANCGITLIKSPAPVGETGYYVVSQREEAKPVLESLITGGIQAIPFGTLAWQILTLEAGTPLYPADIAGELPNAIGMRTALDFEKGCFVGQEVVSRIENRGRPPQRLVGLLPESLPTPGDSIQEDAESIGRITRSGISEILGSPIAMGLLPYSFTGNTVTIATSDGDIQASIEAFPFVTGSEESALIPQYPSE